MTEAARRHDPEASRAAILDAAEHLFLERGFAGASMSEIAKASGVTKSLIHHHFGSKEALWESVKRTRFAGYHDKQMKLLTGQPPTPEVIQASMKVYFEFLADNPQILRMMWWMCLENDRQENELIAELREAGVRHIAMAQQVGILRSDVQPEHILMGFLGMVHAAFSECWVCHQTGTTQARYMDDAWKIFSGGVFPTPHEG
jgi:TetR/AcrR family transcriptional regulator